MDGLARRLRRVTIGELNQWKWLRVSLRKEVPKGGGVEHLRTRTDDADDQFNIGSELLPTGGCENIYIYIHMHMYEKEGGGGGG